MRKDIQIVLNNPTVYIAQPRLASTFFQSKQVVSVRALPKNEEFIIKEELEEEAIEQLDSVEEFDNKVEKGIHKSGFLKKSIDDKLRILTKLPESIQKVICEITTKEGTYPCTIISDSDETVTIKLVDDEQQVEVAKSEILAISIISL